MKKLKNTSRVIVTTTFEADICLTTKTERDTALLLIAQRGDCRGVWCENCPFYYPTIYGNCAVPDAETREEACKIMLNIKS